MLVTFEPIEFFKQILFVAHFTRTVPTFYLKLRSHVDFRFINNASIHNVDLFSIKSDNQHSTWSTKPIGITLCRRSLLSRSNGPDSTWSKKQFVDPPPSINRALDPMVHKDITWTTYTKNTHPIRRLSLSTLVLCVTWLVELGESPEIPLIALCLPDSHLQCLKASFWIQPRSLTQYLSKSLSQWF